jgi:methyl coenzyme M reductase subunit D
VMSADFKLCIKCNKLINILDDHDDCYRHRVCNSEFPCEFSVERGFLILHINTLG